MKKKKINSEFHKTVKSKKTKKNKVKVVNFQKLMGYWKTKENMVPFQSTVKSLLRTFKLGLFFPCSFY